MTKVNVLVKYDPDTIDLYNALIDRVDIWLKATEGVGRFTCRVKNNAGQYTGAFIADDPVQIKIQDIIFMHGYLDSCVPVSKSEKDTYQQELDLAGRDYGQDLMNKIVNKSISLENPGIKGAGDIYPYVNKHADDIIDSMLANAYSEIAFVSPGTAPIITYEDTGSQHLIEAIRKILEKINYDSFVDKTALFHMFPIGTIDSGIILQNGINILKLVPTEFDSHELRNFIIVRGKDLTDGWSEGNYGDFTGDVGNTLSNEFVKVKVGAASIKCTRGSTTDWCAFILTFPKFGYDHLPFDRFGTKEIAAWLSYTTGSEQSKMKICHIELTDTVGHVIELIRYMTIGSPERLAEWDRVSFPIGRDCEILPYGSDKWEYWRFKTDHTTFNWKVTKIKIRSHMYSANEVHTVYLDGLNIPIPMVAYAQDEDSQNYYKVRHLPVNGRNCETQAELQALADSTLAKCMEPIEGLKITALGNAGIIGGECKWIPGYKVKVHSPGDGIANVWYRMVDVHLIVSEEPIMNGQDFIAEVDLIPYDQEVQTRRLGFIKNPEIGLIRQLNDGLRILEELEEPKRDWWPARPRQMAHIDLLAIEADQHHDEFTESMHETIGHIGVGVVQEGTWAQRPDAGIQGRIYHVVDAGHENDGKWYYDNGTSWEELEAFDATQDTSVEDEHITSCSIATLHSTVTIIQASHQTATIVASAHSTTTTISSDHSTTTSIATTHSDILVLADAHTTSATLVSAHSTITVIASAHGTSTAIQSTHSNITVIATEHSTTTAIQNTHGTIAVISSAHSTSTSIASSHTYSTIIASAHSTAASITSAHSTVTSIATAHTTTTTITAGHTNVTVVASAHGVNAVIQSDHTVTANLLGGEMDWHLARDRSGTYWLTDSLVSVDTGTTATVTDPIDLTVIRFKMSWREGGPCNIYFRLSLNGTGKIQDSRHDVLCAELKRQWFICTYVLHENWSNVDYVLALAKTGAVTDITWDMKIYVARKHAHSFSAQPSGHPVSTQPATHSLDTQPSGHPVSQQPSGHPVDTQPSGHSLSVQPSGHTVDTHPTGHTVSQQPSGHNIFTQPSGHPVTTQPSGHPLDTQPSGHPVTTHPTGHTVQTQPAGHSVDVQSAGHTITTQPSGHPVSVQPSGHSVSQQPSGHTVQTQPSGHVVSTQPSGHTVSTQPSGHDVTNPSHSHIIKSV